MASVQLADVIIPEVYMSYTSVNSPELTKFFESGAVVRNPLLDAAFEAGGIHAHMPFWKDLDSTVEPNYSTDNPADVATPNKVVADEMIARVTNWNQGYSAADLAGELAGSDPMQRIRNRFGAYWTRQWQRRCLAVAQGILASNIANNGSDMTLNLALEDQSAVTNANLFSRQAFTGAVFTLGDHFGEIVSIAVHSVVYKRMVDNDDISFIQPSVVDPNLPLVSQMIPTFLGKIVIVDDSMPVTAGTTSGFKYTSILFGAGAIGYGQGSPKVPVEVYRRPDQGNGAGIEQLWERQSLVIHPFGFNFTSNTLSAQSPTNADLKLAANWTRKIERKNVPIAFLITNG